MTHYDTLRVVPWAEDAVIRAAYRTLMRLYHPDTNPDPEAATRVREISSAFAVLSDPERRAAYDALATFGEATSAPKTGMFAVGKPLRPRIRNLVFASVALLAVGWAALLWSLPSFRELSAPDVNANRFHVSRRVSLLPDKTNVRPHANDTHNVVRIVKSRPTQALATKPERVPAPHQKLMLPKQNAAQVIPSVAPAPQPIPKPVLPKYVPPKRAASIAIPAGRSSIAASGSKTSASCDRGSLQAGDGGCADDRQVQIERIAAGFLKQSMEHADWHKQQLLLSARNRSAFSRAMCHSSECVTESYLRQIRETTEIMAGRIPAP